MSFQGGYLDMASAPFTARLTAVTVSGGVNYYDFAEQIVDPSDGSLTALESGRTGTGSDTGAVEVNNQSVTTPCYVWLRLRGNYDGNALYEFDAGDAASGGVTVDHDGTTVGTQPTINLIDGNGITLTVADNTGSSRVDVTVASGLTVEAGGSVVGTQAKLNLIAGNGIALTTTNNTGSSRIDETTAVNLVNGTYGANCSYTVPNGTTGNLVGLTTPSALAAGTYLFFLTSQWEITITTNDNYAYVAGLYWGGSPQLSGSTIGGSMSPTNGTYDRSNTDAFIVTLASSETISVFASDLGDGGIPPDHTTAVYGMGVMTWIKIA